MDIARLRYFSAVYENLNYSWAAQSLYVTRQALQQAVRSLERELGEPLFTVRENNLVPTKTAQLLYRESRKALTAFDEFEAAFSQRHAEVHEVVRQGTITNIHDIMTTKEALDCHRRNFDPRDTHVSGSCDELRALVASGDLDVAYLYGNPAYSEGFTCAIIDAGHPLWLAVPRSHPLAMQAAATVADLQGEAFLGMGNAYDIDKALRSRCREAGFELAVVQTSSNSAALLEKVAMGAGLTYRLTATLPHREDAARIACVALEDAALHWDNYAIFAPGDLGKNPAWRRDRGARGARPTG